MNADEPILVTTQEAAKMLSASEWTVRYLFKKWKIKPVVMGTRKARYAVSDIEALIQTLKIDRVEKK